jgi:GNAT superfamily N-acetyltransferase
MKENEIHFREATVEDKAEILQLFREAFKGGDISEKDPALWDYQVDENPQGKAILGVAVSDNDIVAHYGMLPMVYLDENNTPVKYGLVVDVMVHPEYRRKGVFFDLSRYTLDAARERSGISRAIGFNLTATALRAVLPGHIKVGWKTNARLFVYIMPLNFVNLIRYRAPRLGGIAEWIGPFANLLFSSYLRIGRHLFSRTDRAENDVELTIQEGALEFTQSDIDLYSKLTQNRFRLKKDSDFLAWRLNRHPLAKYALIRASDAEQRTRGIIVYRTFDFTTAKAGIVIDWWSEQGIEPVLFNRLIDELRMLNCDMIILLDRKQSQLSPVRRSLGFINSREYYQSIFYSEDKDAHNHPRNPHLNFIDFDVF